MPPTGALVVASSTAAFTDDVPTSRASMFMQVNIGVQGKRGFLVPSVAFWAAFGHNVVLTDSCSTETRFTEAPSHAEFSMRGRIALVLLVCLSSSTRSPVYASADSPLQEQPSAIVEKLAADAK